MNDKNPQTEICVVTEAAGIAQFLPHRVAEQVEQIKKAGGTLTNETEIAITQLVMAGVLQSIESEEPAWELLQQAIGKARKEEKHSLTLDEIQRIVSSGLSASWHRRELRQTISLVNTLRQGEASIHKALNETIPMVDVLAIISEIRDIIATELADPVHATAKARIVERFKAISLRASSE